MFTPLKYINRHLSRQQFKTAINAHYVSRLMFGSQLWSKSITNREKQRVCVNLNRMVRLIHKESMQKVIGADGKRRFKVSNREVYIRSAMCSFTSLATVADCSLLFKFSTSFVDPLSERLMSQCHTSSRFPNKLVFFDYSLTRIGRSSFVNRSKYISELIPFDWINLTVESFKKKIKSGVPFFVP